MSSDNEQKKIKKFIKDWAGSIAFLLIGFIAGVTFYALFGWLI